MRINKSFIALTSSDASVAWSNITGTPTTLSGYGITDGVPTSRTLTINGSTYDLSANRTWTISSDNIYTANGTLTANRTMTMGGYSLTFTGSATSPVINSTGRILLGGASDNVSYLLSVNGSALITNVFSTLMNCTSVTAQNGQFTSLVRLSETAGPTTPGSGFGFMYAKTDKKVYWKNSDGTEYDLTANSGTPAGSNTQVQFNNSGAFGADSNFVWDNTNKRLGIGVTPTTSLDVNGQIKSTSFLTNASSGTGGQEALRINNDNGYIGFFNGSNTTRSAYIQGNTTDLTLSTSLATPILFYTNNTEKMRLSVSGNLGIGTNSISSALSSSARVLSIVDSATSNLSSVRVYGGASTTSLELYASASTIGLYGSTAHDMIFSTNSSEKMRLTSGGNIGLGVTPSAWNTNTKAIQIGDKTSLFYLGSSPFYTALRHNGFYNASANDIYLTTDFASDYYQSAGQHVWRTAASGTAGNTISWSTPMTLTANGRLLLGTATESTELLQVAGSGRFDGILYFGGGNTLVTSDKPQIFRISGGGLGISANNEAAGNQPIRFYTGGTERVTILAAGPMTLSSLAGTGTRMVVADSSGVLSASTIVTSGTYTPTLTAVSNVASSSISTCMYNRIGSIVTVYGRFSATASASNTVTRINISLPIASNLSSNDLVGFIQSAPSGVNGYIFDSSTVGEAYFVSMDTNSTTYYFNFQYRIV